MLQYSTETMLTTDDMHQIAQLLDERLAPIQKTLDAHTTVLERHSQLLGVQGETLLSHAMTLDRHRHMQLLEAQGRTLESQGMTLTAHSKTLIEQTGILAKHSVTLEAHSTILAEQSKTLAEHGKPLAEHSKMLRSIHRDQKTILSLLDREPMCQRKRIERIEGRLGPPPME